METDCRNRRAGTAKAETAAGARSEARRGAEAEGSDTLARSPEASEAAFRAAYSLSLEDANHPIDSSPIFTVHGFGCL